MPTQAIRIFHHKGHEEHEGLKEDEKPFVTFVFFVVIYRPK